MDKRCSFCGIGYEKAEKLFEGAQATEKYICVYICSGCAELAYGLLGRPEKVVALRRAGPRLVDHDGGYDGPQAA